MKIDKQSQKHKNVSVSAISPLVLLLAVILSVSGCASNATRLQSYCALAEPLILSDQAIDAMLDSDMVQIENHNNTWIAECGR